MKDRELTPKEMTDQYLFGLDTGMFGNNEEKKEEAKEQGIVQMELANILPFHTGDGHPFEVEDDEDMAELEASIDENGILEPVILRPDVNLEGRYETIAGHRRVHAARKKGMFTVPAIIVDYDDDTAIKLMVASNLEKRKHIKPSAKAKAYKMYMDANKRQGKRSDLTSGQVGPKLRTDEKAAEEFSESARTIKRYIRLNSLIEPLLSMVDKDELKFNIGVELSYLSEGVQEEVCEYMHLTKRKLSLDQASQLKAKEKEGEEITTDVIKEMLKKPEKKLQLNEKFVTGYLPEPMRKKSIEERRAYTQQALQHFNLWLKDHPEEQEKWGVEL